MDEVSIVGASSAAQSARFVQRHGQWTRPKVDRGRNDQSRASGTWL